MKKLLLTILAVISLAPACWADSNFHVTRSRVNFTSDLDGNRYWMNTNYAQQARIDGINLAHYCISNNLNLSQAVYLAQTRAYSMMAGTGYTALAKLYCEILTVSARQELNRCGFYYPA
jgi:hypothetical protein